MTEDLEIRVHLDVDDSDVDPALAKVGARAGKKLPTPKLDVDTAAAQQKLGQVDAKAKNVQGTLAKSTALKVDTSDADRGLDEIKARFERQKADIEAIGIKPNMGGGGRRDVISAAGGGAAALGGVAAGVTVVAGAATAGVAGMAKLTGMAAQDERMTNFAAKSLGGTAFVDSAKELSVQTGYAAADIMQAAMAGKGLQQTYGLQADQVAKLVAVSADLAATSPYEDLQSVSKAMGGLKAAMGGDAETAQRLGLSLDDAHMKNVAFGGSLRDTWDGLDNAQKAQAYYTESLRQTQDILGKSADETDVSTQMRKLNLEMTDLGTAMGDALIPAMGDLIELTRDLVGAIPEGAPEAAVKGVGVAATPFKVGMESIPQSWSDVANLPQTIIMIPAQIVGQAMGMTGAAIWPGTGSGQSKVDVNVNVNNNNNSQIDASASAPAPH